MSERSDLNARKFLEVSHQFRLGGLVTESVHPVSEQLSQVAREDVASGLRVLLKVDADVARKAHELVSGGALAGAVDAAVETLLQGGNLYFTGCGSTGRLSIQLDSIWREFWRSQPEPLRSRYEDRTFSVMAGGDYALIKSVEGFEDFTQFGKRQIGDLGLCERDTVFAITEGGETSFVIGTAWEGVERAAKVFFLYNNPDDVLLGSVQRSTEVIQDPRIRKINLTTGPMAITGSTRMQATTIELFAMLVVLEGVIRTLLKHEGQDAPPAESVGEEMLAALNLGLQALREDSTLQALAQWVRLEEATYRASRRNNYHADRWAIDLLTDTTERSPTFCTPPFRKYGDAVASESWSFLFVPYPDSPSAWRHILKRAPRCVAWDESVVRSMVDPAQGDRSVQVVRAIGEQELMRFRIGEDGLDARPSSQGDSAVGLFSPYDNADGPIAQRLREAGQAGARTASVHLHRGDPAPDCGAEVQVSIRLPETRLLLDGGGRLTVKMMLNAISTCTMVRLGRVMGNTMVWVVPSNLKLIDRSTRYIARLAGLDYETACLRLHESIEYVEPRMAKDQAYPPVVGLTVIRVRHNLGLEAAEQRLYQELGL